MADATETTTKTEAEPEKTPEQVADARLDELVGQMNAGGDKEVETYDEDDETLDLPPDDKTKPEPEAEPAKVPTTEPTKDTETTSEKKPSSLVRFARQLGVSEAKIASLPTEALDILCDSLAEKRDAEVAAKAKAEETPEEDEDEVLLKELAEEGIDERVIKLLEKSTKKTKAIEAERAAEKKNAEQKHMAEMIAEVDAAFEALDSPLLGGKAKGATMSQDTEEMERRNLVIRMAFEKPIPGMSLGQRVKHYSRKILGIAPSETPAAAAADPVIEKKKAAWANAGTSRPTKRAEDVEKGEEAAMAAVGKWMKENGWGAE